jgi:AmmeMemoRadiSam system protein B
MNEKPKVRQIEAIPVDTPKGRVVVLRDPFGFSPAILQMSQEAFFVITLLNGTRNIRDIQAIFMRQFGQLVNSEMIEELIEQLDSCHFLDNERFATLKDETIENFLNSAIRPPYHSGTAYPDRKQDLEQALTAMFRDGDAEREINWGKGENSVRGFIVPHIDFERGGPCYGLGYAELAENSQAETYIVLGTAHCDMKKPFSLTLKDFETPLGTLANDRELSDLLLRRCPWLTQDEFSHRSEHSIEFQTVFLQYLFGRRRQISIVPVLCASFRDQDGVHSPPLENPDISAFIDILKEAIGKRGESVCIIAGADLSHVGQRFGDQLEMNEQLLKHIEERDLETLEQVCKVNAEGFFRHVTEDGDRRKICGLPNIYTMLSVLSEGTGKIIKYMQAVDEETNSVVTFASAIIE